MEKDKHKLSLLVADAKASNRNLIIAMLKDQGFCHFGQASDGVQAFQMLKKRPLDFIISGMDMPEMSGLSLLKVVSADENLYKVPFVLIATVMSKEMVVEAGRCGVSAILIQPVKEKVLIDKIQLALGPSTDEKEQKTEALFDKAKELSGKGDYDHALENYEEILNTYEDAEVYFNIGYIKTSQKKYDEALVAFRKAVMINNLHAHAYKMMAEVYAKKGDSKKAQHFFEKAGEIFMERNMDNEAEEAFQEVIRISPNTVNIYNSLGILYRKKRDYKGAIKQYERALKIDPDDEHILYNAGRAYLENKQVKDARKVFERAVAIDSNFKEAKRMIQAIDVGFK